jgi:hypothetical protein
MMTYGQTDRIFRATRRSGYQTQWQQERARGPILPMEQPRRGLLARVLGR